MAWSRPVVAFLLLIAAPGLLRAQGQPLGPEFRVNTYTTSAQGFPRIARDASGNFMVVWYSYAQDGSSGGIFGQRYASTGDPLGGEFRVNTYTSNLQNYPTVISDYAGNFVVVWYSAPYPENASFDVFAQRFDPGGAPLGGEFRVNTHTTDSQVPTSAASDPAGNFVVVWQSRGQESLGYGVFAQRYASPADPMGVEFQVNSYTPRSQTGASIAIDDVGNFVIAWYGLRTPAAGRDIFAQRYSSSGTPLGQEFRVNTYTTNDQYGPAIASASAGDFVIVWDSQLQDGSQGGVFGQRFSSSGTPLGAEFRVNTATAFHQGNPSVASDPDGNFVVTWQGQNPSFLDVFAQRFSSSGVPLGGPSRVNTFTPGNQLYSSVATDPAGNYVVTWMSTSGQDGHSGGIFAQRYNMIVP
jgi:hypothetical protein